MGKELRGARAVEKAGAEATTLDLLNDVERSGGGKVLTVEEAGAALAQRIGKNRVTVQTPSGMMHIDLAGKAHFEKSLGAEIPTPHVKFQELNIGPNGKSLSPGKVEPATMADIRTAQKIIERRGQ